MQRSERFSPNRSGSSYRTTDVLREDMASLVCATCRKLIPPGTSAVRCTVASCNTGRMKLRFCTISCWEKHIPTARHRKAAYIVEQRAAPE